MQLEDFVTKFGTQNLQKRELTLKKTFLNLIFVTPCAWAMRSCGTVCVVEASFCKFESPIFVQYVLILLHHGPIIAHRAS